MWETASDKGNLRGGQSYRDSIGAEDFFRLVSPHTNRWRDVTLPRLGSGNISIDWLSQNRIQLSRDHRCLSLCWSGSPSPENPIMGFSGLAERLLELKLHDLHVHPTDIRRVLAGASQLVSLDLESLVALGERENEVMPENDLNDASRSTIDLPCLTKLSLKSLPWGILGPIVQNLDPSNMEAATIVQHMGDNQDQATPAEPLSSFTARLVATARWVIIHPQSTRVTLKPLSDVDFQYSVELQGPLSMILPWLRLRSLPQITREHFVELIISSDDLGDDPEQVVIENLLHFPRVGYLVLRGERESWRWIWLLSQSDAVQKDPADSEVVKSWLWPELKYLEFNGDSINEFTILSVLLARHGPQAARASMASDKAVPRRLAFLWVRPGKKVWRAEVIDRIRGLVAPGRFQWVNP
ncbi:hypothetical protein FRC00_004131 [Tulasnella sp. 408]|nr:hypothetical protein FRC00_004131 [Tulasnella sp. 408]